MKKESPELVPQPEKPEVEAKEVEAQVETPALPDIKELDAALTSADEVISTARLTAAEVDALIAKHKDAREKLNEAERSKVQRLARVEDYNPLRNLSPQDYKRLAEEEMIEPALVDRLAGLDSRIKKLEGLKDPSAEARAELEKLGKMRAPFRKYIEEKIKDANEKLRERREEVKNKALEHYGKRIEDLQNIIKELEANPRVIERLRKVAEEERMAARERFEKVAQRIMNEAKRYVQSLTDRHDSAFTRIGFIVGDEKILEKLVAAKKAEEEAKTYKEREKAERVFKETRHALINAVILGEGERQIENPEEVTPWETKSAINYFDAIDFLNFPGHIQILETKTKEGDEDTRKLLYKITGEGQLLDQNKILRRLIGKRWIEDPKTKAKRPGEFWAAFETRKQQEEKGTLAALKEEALKLAKEAEPKKQIEDLVARGGIRVLAPVYKQVEIKGVKKTREVSKVFGAIKLEKLRSGKGNEYWQVKEIVGGHGGLKVDDSSPLDMRSFPSWLREAAKQHPDFQKYVT